ncbi:hypothetical protein HPB52_020503 [Rhipicephalus sanguineus]|uniref:THAP-type domain-containing protein n=1 Tax=Rhipicephalus sanguineus TaxID=34632 RepID=A0A9D4T662_RHISA|nr:hypothetical protein HPB52_020503 [Rhipicephalus sanguineus]
MSARRRNYCFAPRCRTGYSRVEDAPKAFNVPRDAERRREWERNLHRAKLDESCAVCELRFEPRFVIRDFVHLIDGKEARIPRDKPLLTEDAVPTILANLPKYLTKTTPNSRKKRKKCESDDAPLNKRSRSTLPCNPSDFAAPETSGINHDSQKEGVTAEGHHCFSFLFGLKVPSKYWSSHQLPDLEGVLYCTSTYLEEGVVTSDKMFLCDKQPDEDQPPPLCYDISIPERSAETQLFLNRSSLRILGLPGMLRAARW